MRPLPAGSALPKTGVARLGGSTLTLGTPRGDHDWQLVLVYRGLHCPICKCWKLTSMNWASTLWRCLLTPKPKPARGYDLSIAQMKTRGLYISDPCSPQEFDRPFAEPGVFVINADGAVQIVDVSNAPFAHPELRGVAKYIKFVRGSDYPVRGTHKG